VAISVIASSGDNTSDIVNICCFICYLDRK
jgi:hypothetical protein